MIGDDDIDSLAGEYVLGTLDVGERSAVAARRQRESALDAAIIAWERRLAPLNDAAGDVAPPRALLAKILARIERGDLGARAGVTLLSLHRRLKIWRGVALFASAIAASLSVVIGANEFAPKPKQQNLVAVLQKDASSPAFLVTVNIEDRLMTVQPIAAKPESGKSFELWLVQKNLGAPRSLGVIDEGKPSTQPTLISYKPDVIESATLAISLEPEGGSPTGKPTGPVVFSGRFVPSK
ncbi:MAG: anti-sigma factor [Proteobacteria bacterium]|nr:anti-sigma factor [Pseudomonadota bacterium]